MKIANNTLQLPKQFRLIEVASQEEAQAQADLQNTECWYIENTHGCKYLCVTVTE